jgi:4-hydroxymandelate oxidase
MISSMAATVAIEEIGRIFRNCETGALWFQLYIQPDLAFTESIVRRAESAGCSALVVSVDSPTLGNRLRDVRNRFFDLPPGMCCENLREPLPQGRFGPPRSIVLSRSLSWEHFDWLRKRTPLKIVLKGIAHPEDARIAVDRGADALFISNHGGRQLDTVPPAIELLPSITEAIGRRTPLIIDGGIRRGTDVMKAIALSATAVAIGRPVLWGLAWDGENGVRQVLELIRTELVRGLELCGHSGLEDLSPDLLHRTRAEAR